MRELKKRISLSWLLALGSLWGLGSAGPLGLLYLGVMPSTVQSATAYSSMAGGDIAISVIAAGLLSILGVFVSAPLFALLSGGAAATLGVEGLQRIFLILTLPFLLGQLVQPWLAEALKRRSTMVARSIAGS